MDTPNLLFCEFRGRLDHSLELENLPSLVDLELQIEANLGSSVDEYRHRISGFLEPAIRVKFLALNIDTIFVSFLPSFFN